MSKRNYNISKKMTRYLWTCEVTDSDGNEYRNYFETQEECMKFIYYTWENEDKFNNQNSDELLSNAIAECVQMDIDRGVAPSLD